MKLCSFFYYISIDKVQIRSKNQKVKVKIIQIESKLCVINNIFINSSKKSNKKSKIKAINH